MAEAQPHTLGDRTVHRQRQRADLFVTSVVLSRASSKSAVKQLSQLSSALK
jgi:hypothetical protein